jgi:hypothetical protein
MKKSTDGYSLLKRQLKRDLSSLTQKELAMLRLAKRAGTSLEATAKLILLLRAQKKAVAPKAAMG